VEAVDSTIADYVDKLASTGSRATATHISTDIDLVAVSEEQFAASLANRLKAGPEDRSVYASYITERLLGEMEARCPDIIFQFSCGAEPLPFETSSRLSQETIGQIGEIIARHPKLRFMCFLGSSHANQAMCTLARELPNLTLAGFWWHNFFPSVIRRIIDERLDMLPLNRQIGFFSDAYCIEWAYAKSRIVSAALAEVLAAHVFRGRFSKDEALDVAKTLLYETPKQQYLL